MIEKGCNGKNAKLFFLRTKNGMKQHCDMKIKFYTNEGRMLLWVQSPGGSKFNMSQHRHCNFI